MEDFPTTETEIRPLELFEIKTVPVEKEAVGRSGFRYLDKDTGLTVYRYGRGRNSEFLEFIPDLTSGSRYTQLKGQEEISKPHRFNEDRGGVLKMEDKKTGRIVAAKTILRGSEEIVREGRTLARLQHPNIVTIYDLAVSKEPGDYGAEVFLITEWIEGSSLKQWMDKRHSLREAASVIDEISNGVSYINRQGWVYGDLKPQNIKVDHHGIWKIYDMRLAVKLKGKNEGKGWPSGTPPYAPPEQQWGVYSNKTDVYSLGVLVYEILCDRLEELDREVEMFQNNETGQIDLRPEYKTLFEENIEAMQDLDHAIRKAINLRREGRYNSVEEFNEELQRIFSLVKNRPN